MTPLHIRIRTWHFRSLPKDILNGILNMEDLEEFCAHHAKGVIDSLLVRVADVRSVVDARQTPPGIYPIPKFGDWVWMEFDWGATNVFLLEGTLDLWERKLRGET